MGDPITLAARRLMLIEKSDALRETIALELSAAAPLLGLGDRVGRTLRWLKQHPLWVAGGVIALLVWRPARSMRWLKRGVFLWGICKRAGAAWQKSLAVWREARR
ncbi:MAG: hypothetical protein RIR70_732 [Pseudomonadota bacterium]|jgi:hypothetical protein